MKSGAINIIGDFSNNSLPNPALILIYLLSFWFLQLGFNALFNNIFSLSKILENVFHWPLGVSVIR